MRFLLVLAAAATLAACSWRDWIHADPRDAEKGAGIGAFLAGPSGAPIGAAIGLIVGAIVRGIEKPRLERRAAADRAALTEHWASKLERVATTARTARRDDALDRNPPSPEPGV